MAESTLRSDSRDPRLQMSNSLSGEGEGRPKSSSKRVSPEIARALEDLKAW